MEITVYPSVKEIFNVTKMPSKTIVKRSAPSYDEIPIAEYVMLPSFETIGETVNDIYAIGNFVFIEMKKH